MQAPIEREWQAALETLEREHMGRHLVGAPTGPDFLSNDVLGLSRHPAVKKAAALAAEEYGVGSRGSRLLGGDHPLLIAAENAAAQWIGTEAALLFPSGFQANLGVLGALTEPGDVLFSDELNHASLIDGARLSRAKVHVYGHLDVDHLDRALAATQSAKRRFVVTESLFSMDGDLAPLAAIAESCKRLKANLIVDEAHAAGLLGLAGRGACDGVPGLEEVLIARIVTGGKALGSAGAFVLGSHTLRRTLLHRARSFIYTTGMPLPIAAALMAAMGVMPQLDTERKKIRQGAKRLADLLGLPEPAGAIVPVPCGSPEKALELAAHLQKQGLQIHAVRPPTVPEGSSRLRIVVHADHNPEDLKAIAETIGSPATITPKSKQPKPWFVVGTDTDVGKTVASALLIHAASPARYWKAIQSGQPCDTDSVRQLTTGCNAQYLPNGFTLSLAKSPDQAARLEGRVIHESRLDALLNKYNTESPAPLIVETAGGLLVPWNDHFQNIDWLARHRPNVVLVARSGLGTLNHTQLTLHALLDVGIVPKALMLIGPPHEDNRQGLATRFSGPILQVPHLDPLNNKTLADLAATLPFDWMRDD